jgi:hypothetical protein
VRERWSCQNPIRERRERWEVSGQSQFGARLNIGFQVLTVGNAPNLGASGKDTGEQPQCGQAAEPDT